MGRRWGGGSIVIPGLGSRSARYDVGHDCGASKSPPWPRAAAARTGHIQEEVAPVRGRGPDGFPGLHRQRTHCCGLVVKSVLNDWKDSEKETDIMTRASHKNGTAFPDNRPVDLAGPLGPGAGLGCTRRRHGQDRAGLVRPCNQSTSILLIQHVGPAEMRTNVPFTYEVHIRNLTEANLPELEVANKLPPAFKVSSIDPKPANSDEATARWVLTQLGPKAEQVIKINGHVRQCRRALLLHNRGVQDQRVLLDENRGTGAQADQDGADRGSFCATRFPSSWWCPIREPARWRM